MEDSQSKPVILEDFSNATGIANKGKYQSSNDSKGPIKKQAPDLAPIHYCASKSSRNAQVEKKHMAKSSHSKEKEVKASLTNDFHEKLNLTNKNCINGIKVGTTDVEVHYGLSPLVSEEHLNKLSQIPSTSKFEEDCGETDSSSCSSKLCSLPHTQNTSQQPNVNSDSTTCSSAYSAIISNCSRQDATNSGAMCNGHTVSEATSTNSIAVSDLSISSEKSNESYSCSGARPRTRNESNSSSYSTQPRSDADSSFNSDSCKPLDRVSEINSASINSDEVLNMKYVNYENECQMGAIMRLIQKDLSEPYSIYTYRYFIHNWPKLCFLALHKEEIVGAIVCKLDVHKKSVVRGYIAMLAVDERYRKRRIGSNLVQQAIRAMAADEADEVVLETEITNKSALQLYENLGFVRDKRLFRYYLNGVDALRLKLWLR